MFLKGKRMNRAEFYNYIEERLTTLAYRIERRGSLNILDYHVHSEYFYRDFFNLLYGWQLKDLNEKKQNIEAIDLADDTNKIIIQVSATNTREKIDGALSKPLLQDYQSYTFKFISIAKSAESLKGKTFNVPQGISFDPQSDIYDVNSVLREIRSFDIDKMNLVYDFIKKELGYETQTIKLESNLTSIIRLLSKEDLSITNSISVEKEFDIDRKINFNNLSVSKALITEYKIYQTTVDKIYAAFDKMGQNKSMSVLSKIHKIYLELNEKSTGDALYQSITERIKTETLNSNNLDSSISVEELDLCIDIIIVDAFIRCKIFENPEKYNHATTR